MVRPQQLLDALDRVIIGKPTALRLVLATLLAGGHVLLEDVPGTAKTLLARALARVLDLHFARIQMTPDLLPADLTGTGIWHDGERRFIFQPGPVFAQLLLADELNRATPRTQAGLLEAMEERVVTADGAPHALPEPFFVIATQNPIEQQGVFPLPEAQLDRFMVQLALGYPTQAEEVAIVAAQAHGHPLDALTPLATLDDLRAMRAAAEAVHVDDSVREYLVQVARATRQRAEVQLGASPRASLALHHMARALAFLEGAPFVRPDHVKQVAAPVLRHRLVLAPQARLAGQTPDQVIAAVLHEVEAPLHVGGPLD